MGRRWAIGSMLWLGLAAAVMAAEGPDLSKALRPEPLKDLGKTGKVRLVYFVPGDREPTPCWRQKITVLMTFVGDLYRRDLQAKGYPTRGLDFEFDADGPAVRFLKGKHGVKHYNGDPKFDFMAQWRSIVPEVEAAYGPAGDHLYVIFAETYDDGPTEFEWRGGVALGARYSPEGGVGLFSAWILRDEFCATTVEEQLRLLNDETPIKGRVALGCGRMDSPRFEFIEDGFGAVAHELGHTFGLPHDLRKDDRYIMGNGFRSLRRNYAAGGPQDGRAEFSPDNARILARSRFLAEDADAEDTETPAIEIGPTAPLKVGATTVPLRLTVTDNRQLAAVLYFAPQPDSIVGGADLDGARAQLRPALTVPPVRKGKGPYEIVVSVIDKGGNLTVVTAKFEVQP